jgi:hypothetical protein
MYIPFDQLPPHARLWIYQSNQPLRPPAQAHISHTLQNFIDQWTAHQQTLHASYCILHDHFVIIGINQDVNAATGCSIDKLTHIIQTIDNELTVQFFNRLLIAHQDHNDPAAPIVITQKKDFKNAYKNNQITNDTFVFDTLILQKHQLSYFKLPLKNSWHYKMLGATTA